MMAQHVDDTIEMERNAGLIMGTNNSSIVSKRSVERLYLPEPHFYRYFVRKPQRRSPTINRGYWLRMRAVDWTVRQFLEKQSETPKIVINLGCGYDPLPFQWLASEPDLCSTTKFIDIDYEELLISKREIIRNTSKMRNLLSNMEERTTDKSILLDTKEYAAIGCDLRNLRRLQRLLNLVCESEKHLVLCVAEVSMTYMPTDAADALIEWAAKLSPDVMFCLLEQGSPDRPDHPFTATMVKHFQKIGTPLHSLFEYPGMHSNIIRFQRAGFTHCEVQNLWELWSNPRFLSPSQRLALDHVEPFDEWEEFALFASHYLLIIAHNRPGGHSEPEHSRSRRDSIASIASDISARTVSPFKRHAQWFAMKYSEDSGDSTKRHHASAYQLADQDAVAMHGGIGPKARLSSTVVCRDRFNHEITPVVPPPDLSPRCCHTITTLSNGQNILVGGRGSPTQAMVDCWIQTGPEWTRINDLPEPRYRHRTVPVTLPDGAFGAVVFGGKTDASRVATDTLLWHPKTGWEVLVLLHQSPVPRFGASFVYLGFNHGLLFGGMRQDGIVCQGLWRWRLIIRDNKVAGISFRTSNALDASIGAYPWFARLGASCGLVRDELIIIGGIAKSGCIPKIYEILSVLGSFSAFNEYEKEMQLRLTTVEPETAPGCPRPFFIGHSTHRTKTGTLVFMGGGATCFSFGNYYNSGIWIVYEREAGLHVDWTVVKGESSRTRDFKPQDRSPRKISNEVSDEVKPIRLENPEATVRLIRDSRPAIMRGLDLGDCLTAWTPVMLRDKVPQERIVVIHNSPTPSMNFQRKDFAYKSVSFTSFVSALLSPSSHIYLRALSKSNPSTTPANFEEDWPELARDVEIPHCINAILQKTKHSSCLRIANNTTMWLHYDVMANFLFQIHGSKKLVLFPPKDIKYLSFPPGSTTSEIDIFRHPSVEKSNFKASIQISGIPSDIKPHQQQGQGSSSQPIPKADKNHNTEAEIFVPKGTTPQIVTLNPGDALFIPPLWAHTGISLRHTSNKHVDSQSESPPQPQPQPNTTQNIETTTTQTGTSSTATPSLDNNQSTSKSSSPSPSPSPSPIPLARTGNSNEYTNIALNVFFRSLPRQTYATGRDVYGNRDLAAYEDSRRDLDRIIKKFTTHAAAASASASTSKPSSGPNGKKARGRNGDGTDPLALGEGLNAAGTVGEHGEPANGSGDVDVADGICSSIPKNVIKAYLERLADELKRKADEV